MEKTLKLLFDFQKFSGSKRLAKMIEDTEKRYGGALTDDVLEEVSAAGEPFLPNRRKGVSDD